MFDQESQTAEQPSVQGGADRRDPSLKRVLVLVGSPHKGGATRMAAERLVERLEAFGDIDSEVLTLSDYEIGPCRGCKLCFDRGEESCPLQDDRDVLIGKMESADGLVLAAPLYSWQVPGVMKTFLDRIGFVFHRPRFHGKTATTVIVQGIAFGGRARKYLEFVASGLGYSIVKGSVSRTLEPMSDAALDAMNRNLADQARRFHRQLLRPPFATPSVLKLMMFRMSRTGIKLNAPREARDWAFYRDKGWFESDYYYPVHLGPVKRVLGAAFDWAGAHTSTFKVAKAD